MALRLRLNFQALHCSWNKQANVVLPLPSLNLLPTHSQHCLSYHLLSTYTFLSFVNFYFSLFFPPSISSFLPFSLLLVSFPPFSSSSLYLSFLFLLPFLRSLPFLSLLNFLSPFFLYPDQLYLILLSFDTENKGYLSCQLAHWHHLLSPKHLFFLSFAPLLSQSSSQYFSTSSTWCFIGKHLVRIFKRFYIRLKFEPPEAW